MGHSRTLAQVVVLVRFVFQILRVEFAGRTLLRPMRSAPRFSESHDDKNSARRELRP